MSSVLSPLPGDDVYLGFSIPRRITIGIVLSLLVHAAFFISIRLPDKGLAPSAKVHGPLSVDLRGTAPLAQRMAEFQPPLQQQISQPPPQSPSRILTIPTGPQSARRAARAPAPPAPPQTDMLAMVNNARAHRGVSPLPPENPQNSTPTPDQIAMSRIQKNIEAPRGTSGVFGIRKLGTRYAEFSFHGWTGNANSPRNEIIEVDAGLNGDVELAVVRKMIEVIRKYYSGDFNWESRRLGRVIVLSARRDDSASLESFLMLEFFSGRG